MSDVPVSGDPIAAARQKRRASTIEIAIAVVALVVSGVWSAQFWNTWIGQGGQPEFYQAYFEPAVMVACGHGLVIADQRPKALEDFLQRRRDGFECSELPAGIALGDSGMYQEAWAYLLYTVGWAWRILGISWSGLGPLFGTFFGVATTLAYGIFRLGMGRWIAVLCTVGVATSSLHLVNLPHLRDYSKTPFTLGLVLIVGLLVLRPPRPLWVLVLSAAYGAVLGLGYGFRTDLLINLPVLVVVLFAFLPGGVTKNLITKSAATILFLATFVVVSLPITSAVYNRGGCQWHVALLGLQLPFQDNLRLDGAPYDFGYAYNDGYVISGVQGFAHRTDPTAVKPAYCSRDYDIQSGRLLGAIVTSFPADFVVRAYASILQIVQQPFAMFDLPARDWGARFFQLRRRVLLPWQPWAVTVVASAIVFASGASLRLGLFLLFFLAYFGGYPAVQFQPRHFFHLEFIGWWALGFVVQRSASGLRNAYLGERVSMSQVRQVAVRLAVVLVIAVALFGGVLSAARWYQSRQVRNLLTAYVTAPKTLVDVPTAPLPGIAPADWPQLLEVELNQDACGTRPTLTFRYGQERPDLDFTRTMTIDQRSRVPGTTRVFLPVYEQFAGLDVSPADQGCVAAVYRVTDLRPFPILLGATLPPEWESLPLYQRLQ